MNPPMNRIPPPPADPSPNDPADLDITPPGSGALVRHPDGWYWLGDDGRQQFGPFDSADDALTDMEAAGDDSLEPGESLHDAEREIGLADWVDPDTGELAEDTHTRIEDH